MALTPTNEFSLTTSSNKISVRGALRQQDLRRVLAAIHNTISVKGYKDIELDFSKCMSAFAGPMLAISSQVRSALKEGVDTDLILPEHDKLRRLFLNCNWAHLIDFRHFEPSSFKGHTHVPALKFSDADECYEVVNRALDIMLSVLSDFDRSHLSAIEWSVSEITDNVINHSESSVGGIFQVTNFSKNKHAIEYAVCDAGVGIPHTLRQGHPEISTDAEALERAIREGITRDTLVGQGNGLYGSWRVSAVSGGTFAIDSGYSSLRYNSHNDLLHVSAEKIPYDGCLVVASINYDNPLILEEALNFKGKAHFPVDYIELKYETTDDGSVLFDLDKESSGFGSRSAGEPVRKKLANLLRICEGKKLVIDFSAVPLVSSSYADEVFGKLFLEMGPLRFSNCFDFSNIQPIIRSLIDRAIQQRMTIGSNK